MQENIHLSDCDRQEEKRIHKYIDKNIRGYFINNNIFLKSVCGFASLEKVEVAYL